MKKRHLVAINLINLLVIASFVDCIQLDNELVSKPQRKCKHKLILKWSEIRVKSRLKAESFKSKELKKLIY